MTIWGKLGIERTRDKKRIRHAYAEMSVRYHPEEHPEEFKEIYEAYQRALCYATNHEFDYEWWDDLDEDEWEDLIEEVYEVYNLKSLRPSEMEWIDSPDFEKETNEVTLEDLIGMKTDPQSSESAEEGGGIDFSGLLKELDFSTEAPVSMDLIDGIIRNMKIIIGRTKENIIWKGARMLLGGKNSRSMWEWRSLLESSGFHKVRNDPRFLLKLSQLKGISRLPFDMVKCLYKELDFAFIEEMIEGKEYRELHRVQRRGEKRGRRRGERNVFFMSER